MRHICDFTSDYDMLLQQMQRNETKEDIAMVNLHMNIKYVNPLIIHIKIFCICILIIIMKVNNNYHHYLMK